MRLPSISENLSLTDCTKTVLYATLDTTASWMSWTKLQWCQRVFWLNFLKNSLLKADYDVADFVTEFAIRQTFSSLSDDIINRLALIIQCTEIVLVLQGILSKTRPGGVMTYFWDFQEVWYCREGFPDESTSHGSLCSIDHGYHAAQRCYAPIIFILALRRCLR